MSNKPDHKEKSEKPELVGEEGPITTRAELKQVEERVAIGANMVYEALRREGDDELHRPGRALHGPNSRRAFRGDSLLSPRRC